MEVQRVEVTWIVDTKLNVFCKSWYTARSLSLNESTSHLLLFTKSRNDSLTFSLSQLMCFILDSAITGGLAAIFVLVWSDLPRNDVLDLMFL